MVRRPNYESAFANLQLVIDIATRLARRSLSGGARAVSGAKRDFTRYTVAVCRDVLDPVASAERPVQANR